MNHNVLNLVKIQEEIQLKLIESNNTIIAPEIIAVSKTISMKEILPVINHGHKHFGENKIQEAVEKWENIKQDFDHICLHMIGKLQKNKAKYVVKLFDYLHSLDNLKLAEKLSSEEKKQKKKLKIFIQINFENESQKSGITLDEVDNFYKKCTNDLNLNIIGFMCIPPQDGNNELYFKEMKNLLNKYKLKELSMGMSSDYLEAIKYQSTFVRIGTKIFGKRN
jgi:PLP dependent protein|tara:strand:- start:725 stop:1390 length:666 start_codon:yes stop_codon:yes gene_type:complete